LIGRDYFPGSTPFEVGLEWAVDLDKPDFVGKQAVLRRRDAGLKTRLFGLEMPLDSHLPNPDDSVLSGGRAIGKVTNAAVSEGIGRILARAWLPADTPRDAELEVLTASDRCRAVFRTSYCWYDPRGRRLRK